jgi:hypothetical protein
MSPAIELDLERPHDRLTVYVDTEQLLDAPLGAVEALLRHAREAAAVLSPAARRLERQIAPFELFDDVTEPPDSVLEGHAGHRR